MARKRHAPSTRYLTPALSADVLRNELELYTQRLAAERRVRGEAPTVLNLPTQLRPFALPEPPDGGDAA